MKSIPVALTAALALCVVAVSPSVSPAQTIKSGRRLTIDEHRVDFKEPVNACLKLCTNIVLERQTFECRGFFVPSYEGCDLPWIDSYDPNPDFSRQGNLCIPPENEFGGYLLSERRERIERQVRQGADCKSVVTETVLQQLPPLGNPPRSCPDPGPWDSTDETILSIQFVACR